MDMPPLPMHTALAIVEQTTVWDITTTSTCYPISKEKGDIMLKTFTIHSGGYTPLFQDIDFSIIHHEVYLRLATSMHSSAIFDFSKFE